MPNPVFLTAEWRRLLMLNFEIDPAVLEPRVPAGTELDTFDGQTLVSLVGFRFLRTQVCGWSIPGHQDFDEVNLRFYVRREHPECLRRGVVFIREIAPRMAISLVARWVYQEPYVTRPMRHRFEPPFSSDHALEGLGYGWFEHGRWQQLSATLPGPARPLQPGSAAEFLTEHYWGYTRLRNGSTAEYQVEHAPWNVWDVETCAADLDASEVYGRDFGQALSRPPVSALVADGSPVIVRRGTRITG